MSHFTLSSSIFIFLEKLEEFFENARLDPNTFDGGVYRLLTEENQMLKDKLLQLERLTVFIVYFSL